MAAFRQATRSRGLMERAELIKDTANCLGYRRLGEKIQEVLRNHLRTAIRRGIIETDGRDRVRGGPETLAEFTLEELREMFKNVMSKRHSHEREEVIINLARYLGFSRLSEVGRTAIRAAITSGLRQRVLSAHGEMIQSMIRQIVPMLVDGNPRLDCSRCGIQTGPARSFLHEKTQNLPGIYGAT